MTNQTINYYKKHFKIVCFCLSIAIILGAIFTTLAAPDPALPSETSLYNKASNAINLNANPPLPPLSSTEQTQTSTTASPKELNSELNSDTNKPAIPLDSDKKNDLKILEEDLKKQSEVKSAIDLKENKELNTTSKQENTNADDDKINLDKLNLDIPEDLPKPAPNLAPTPNLEVEKTTENSLDVPTSFSAPALDQNATTEKNTPPSENTTAEEIQVNPANPVKTEEIQVNPSTPINKAQSTQSVIRKKIESISTTDQVEKFRKEIQKKHDNQRIIPQIEKNELVDSELKKELREKANEAKLFIENETKILLLPEDDVSLGKISYEVWRENLDYHDFLSLAEKVENNSNRLQEGRNIEQFLEKYAQTHEDDNLALGEIMQFANAVELIRQNNIYDLSFLLNNSDVEEETDDNGNNLLHIAVNYNNYEAAKLLIIKGININRKNTNQETAFDIAKKMQNNDIIYFLKNAGGDLLQ